MTKKYTPTISHYSALVTFDQFRDDADELVKIANLISQKLGLRVVQKFFHAFEPMVKTLIFILSQSHLAIHSYPEDKMIHIDLLSCLELTEAKFKTVLESVFKDRKGAKIISKDCNFVMHSGDI